MRRKDRRAGLFALLLLVTLGAILVQPSKPAPRAAESTLRSLLEVPMLSLAAAGESAVSFVGELFRREQLHGRIAELEERLARAEFERAQLEEMRLENQRLEELLGLRASVGFALRAARVVTAGAAAGSASLVIDAGSQAGVALDAAVLAPGGLVGRVVKVGQQSAVVQPITDSVSGLGVLFSRSRVQGVMVGGERGRCRVKYVPNLEDVTEGDEIVASGLDGIYPKGVMVGRVAKAQPGADTFQEIEVEPAVSLLRLETVLVQIGPGAAVSKPGRDELAQAQLPVGREAGRR